MNTKELISKALSVAKDVKHNGQCRSGEVGCALITDKNNLFLGTSIDCSCGIGFCAEHSAIANMITNGESRIKLIVAVSDNEIILSPCGRCREFIYEVNNKNSETDVVLSKDKTIKLKELLPHPWQNAYKPSKLV